MTRLPDKASRMGTFLVVVLEIGGFCDFGDRRLRVLKKRGLKLRCADVIIFKVVSFGFFKDVDGMLHDDLFTFTVLAARHVAKNIAGGDNRMVLVLNGRCTGGCGVSCIFRLTAGHDGQQ